MLKENGRLEPAAPEELANLKGKHMVCPKCGEYSIIAKPEFATSACGKCGAKLFDVEMASAAKTTGKK